MVFGTDWPRVIAWKSGHVETGIEKLLLTLLVAKATWARGGTIEATPAICSADCQNHSISAILYDL